MGEETSAELANQECSNVVLLSCKVFGQLSFLEEVVDCGLKANPLMFRQGKILEIEYERVDEVTKALLQPFVGRNFV
jgi:hypothetical protein